MRLLRRFSMKMTVQQQKTHDEAVHWFKVRKRADSNLIDNFIHNQKEKLYRFFGKTSLFDYAVEVIGMSEPVANSFITVVRKAIEVPELSHAIRENKLSVCKASRI